MVRYQNLTRKPELFRAMGARVHLDPGSGTMYPLNPLSQALGGAPIAGAFSCFEVNWLHHQCEKE